MKAVLLCSSPDEEARARSALARECPGAEVVIVRSEAVLDSERRAASRAGGLERQLTRRELQSEALVALGQLALSGAPLDQVIAHASHLVVRFLECARVRYLAGDEPADLSPAVREAVRNALRGGDPRTVRGTAGERAVVIPLVGTGGTVGVLVAEEPGGDVKREDLRFAVSAATLVAASAGRTLADEALRASAEQFRLLAETIREVFWMADATKPASALYVNAAYEEVWQRPRRGITADPEDWLAGIHPEDRHAVRAWAAQSRERDTSAIQYRVVRPDGTVRWIRDRAFHIRDATGRTTAIAGLAMDVTEEHQLTRRLDMHRAVTEILAGARDPAAVVPQLLETMGRTLEMRAGGAWILDEEAGTLRNLATWSDRSEPDERASEQATRTITFRIGEGLPGRVSEARAPAWIPDLEADLGLVRATAAIRSGMKSGFAFPVRMGGRIWGVIDFYQPFVREPDTELMQVLDTLGSQIGETMERTRIERAHARLAAVIEATQNCVGLATRDLKMIYVNSAGRQMMGIAADEDVTGAPMEFAYTPERWQQFTSEVLPVVFEKGFWQGESSRNSRSGEEIPVWQVVVGHRGAEGQIEFFSTICQDLRERRRLEAQLRQAQKMEAIGQLAGGVAHDFNNLLTIILGHIDLALEDEEVGGGNAAMLETVRRAAERASGLTRQLLAFSRKQVLQPRRIAMNGVVLETCKMLPRMLGEDIRMVMQLADGLPPVLADPGQLTQVVMNLAVNARDAMPRGGSLTLSTRLAPDGTGPGTGERVVLSVVDSGTGMTPSVRERVFEPFFTTKGRDRGTGLGLSTVYGIVKQSGGEIELETEVGVGTAFHIYWPAHRGTDMVADRPVPTPRASTGETILVIEDQEEVRLLARTILRRRGYRVLEAGDVPGALEAARSEPGTIDLVLADLVLADGTGPEAVAQLRRLRPGLKALYMTGYTDDTVLRYGVHGGSTSIVEKPFTAATLESKVREAIDASTLGA